MPFPLLLRAQMLLGKMNQRVKAEKLQLVLVLALLLQLSLSLLLGIDFDLQPDLLLEPDQLKLGLDMTQKSYQKRRDSSDSRTDASRSLSLTSSTSVSGNAVLNDYRERYDYQQSKACLEFNLHLNLCLEMIELLALMLKPLLVVLIPFPKPFQP